MVETQNRMIPIPISTGGELVLELTANAPILIVGPNGSGKSALANHMQRRLGSKVNRVFAHRRLWLDSSVPGMAPSTLQQHALNLERFDTTPESRWKDQADAARLSLVIQELLSKQNFINSEIANRARQGALEASVGLDGPLEILNRIMAEAALNVEVRLSPVGGLSAINTHGETYPAAEMSDGEKAAMLLVSDVVVVDEGTVHIIDEPERHLHRSISASLINSLVTSRANDCFIILTHDLELAVTLGRTGRTFVCSGCEWSGKSASRWQIDEVPPGEGLPEGVRRAVLGGRKNVVFHEGVTGGLDQQLYETLLPGWTVVAAGSCADVIRGVGGLRTQDSLHWLNSKGIVDKDFRRDSLPPGVVRLQLHEIENIFYHSKVIEVMCRSQALTFGLDYSELLNLTYREMRTALLVPGVRAKIVEQRCVQEIRDIAMQEVESIKKVPASGTYSFTHEIDRDLYEKEYQEAIEATTDSLDAFLEKFPVRESGLRGSAAKALRYPSMQLYERAVIQLGKRDDDFRETLVLLSGLSLLKSA